MTAYYNEHDPKAAAWLRELIKAGHIAPGDVDERSIEDVVPNELAGYTQCHFFAGIGGWPYALRCAGWPDDRPVWTGSCPCQPFSQAGQRGGTFDERHLWPAFYHLISQSRPDVVFGEQVASPDGLDWLDLVHDDLEAAGYAVGALDLCAAGFGAPHIRQRLYFVGDADGKRFDGQSVRLQPGRPRKPYSQIAGAGATNGYWRGAEWIYCRDGKYRAVEPGTFPLAHGVPARVGRLRGYGNAIVAPVAEAFVRAYLETASPR